MDNHPASSLGSLPALCLFYEFDSQDNPVNLYLIKKQKERILWVLMFDPEMDKFRKLSNVIPQHAECVGKICKVEATVVTVADLESDMIHEFDFPANVAWAMETWSASQSGMAMNDGFALPMRLVPSSKYAENEVWLEAERKHFVQVSLVSGKAQVNHAETQNQASYLYGDNAKKKKKASR